jgi:hypothetical protein
MINLTAIPKQNIYKFIVLWVLLSATYYLALGVVAQAIPKRIEWILDSILPASILVALAVSFMAIERSNQTETADDLFKGNAKFGLYGAVILVVIYMISTFVSPIIVTQNQLRDALNHAELTEIQKQEITKILENENVVTTEELQKIGLNNTQIEQVVNLVSKLGYVRQQEVVAIVRTETANMATATAIALQSTCYVEPKNQYASVSIRHEPKVNVDNAIAYLARGEKVKVIGQTMVGHDLWWKIELSHGVGSVQGWVTSWPVDMSNEVACNNVPVFR